jgi:2-keto-3-deoxy-L-rhamnonate aldolase RhmA
MNFKNRTKQLLKEGKPTVGVFVCVPSYDVAELFSKVGLDWELFDLEHGSIQFETLHWLLAAASGNSTPLVRIPSHDPANVKLALDGGAQGIMFPQVNTRKEAEEAVRACRYPPKGIRGVGPRRASLYYTEYLDYIKSADRETMVIVQIETREAVTNIDEILSVEGIDAAFVGPADLSASMGYIESFPKLEREVLDAIAKVLKTARKHEVAPGIWGGSVEKTNRFIKQGFRFIALGEDVDYLTRVKDDLALIDKKVSK